MDLSIIIVNYNVKEFLLNLLDSLTKATKNFSAEIIVVDNASTDGSINLLNQKYPAVKTILNNENIGFGAANNKALKISKGKYIVLINPDTIVKEDTFVKLVDFFERHPEVGLAGCKVLNPDGTLQLACRRSFPGPWTSFTKVFGLSKLFPKSKLFAKYNLTYLDENKSYEVDAISGAFMMMKREVYETIGGFDTQFFMYGEDLDYCYRTQKAGYKVYYFSGTEIIHFKGESTKRSDLDETKMFYNAMHLFVKKHFSSSFIVSSILQTAIIVRKLVAFANVYKHAIAAMFLDFIFFVAALFFAEKIYKSSHWLGFPGFVKPWIYILPAVLQLVVSAFFGAYKKNSISILKSWASLILGFFILSSLTFFLKQFAFSRAVVLITYAFLFFMYPAWRILYKIFFSSGLTNASTNVRTLVVGTGEKAIDLVKKLKMDINSMTDIVGFISVEMNYVGSELNGYKVIGNIDGIRKIVKDKKIEKVIFSSNDLSFEKMFSVVSKCQGENVEFLVSGNEADYLVGKSMATQIDDVPLLKMYYNISSSTHKIIKAIADRVISLLILIFIYPFVYFFDKLGNSRNDFINFVLNVPKVFTGKMSLVGPKFNSYYKDLFMGKLGLSGLWYTENVDLADQSEINKLDLFYAKNQNLWLDLEILGKSFAKMFYKMEKKQ